MRDKFTDRKLRIAVENRNFVGGESTLGHSFPEAQPCVFDVLDRETSGNRAHDVMRVFVHQEGHDAYVRELPGLLKVHGDLRLRAGSCVNGLDFAQLPDHVGVL